MPRLIASLLVAFALVFGARAAQAIPHYPNRAAMAHMNPAPMPAGSTCVHGMHIHKGAPCPMASCSTSLPLFLPAADAYKDFTGAVASVPRTLPSDWAVSSSLTGVDPPVPRFS